MKKGKITRIIIFMFCIVMSLSFWSMTYAAQATNPLYLGILAKRATTGMGYSVGDAGIQGAENQTAYALWNIVKYNSASIVQGETPTESNIYCLKAGVGSLNNHEPKTYNVYYDMKTERNAIKTHTPDNGTLAALVEGTTIPKEDGTTVKRYNAILAMLDRMFIKGTTSENEKIALLEAAGINLQEETAYGEQFVITDDEIMAIQQAAIWYLTNYGEDSGKYDKLENTGWLYYTEDGTNYSNMTGYNPTSAFRPTAGERRQAQVELLYKYLIRTAINNANDYENSSDNNNNTIAPAVVDTTTLQTSVEGANTIVGPIHITQNSDIPFDIDFIVKNGNNPVTDYVLLDENKNPVQNGKTVKDLVGNDFYFSTSSNNANSLVVDININYSNKKLTMWLVGSSNEEQPVVIPEVSEISDPYHLTLEQPFDLALRKYITKVGTKVLEGSELRAPRIDTATTLDVGRDTASYKHKKDPVTVETGTIVTYKLTVYNEGNKAGRATKIVDQLPTGLKFSQVISGNFELDSYSESDNKLLLKRKTGNEENLNAYVKGGTLDSETIEIECEVVARPDTNNSKVLTNVAWISEEYDAVSNKVITNHVGDDRDSEPSTIPSVNKDNMSDYKGNEVNKQELSDSDYYYKGQQDDDDFEKLILLPETFDLALMKRITQVNGQNVPNRIIKEDPSKLNTVDLNGNMITTADYKYNEIPVQVKKGDIVKYTFRIYNEGTIDGYASEITEDIPEGLEFIWSEKTDAELDADTTFTAQEKEAIKFNQQYLWGNFKFDTNNKIIKVSSDYLSKAKELIPGANLIKAFGRNDGTKTAFTAENYKELSIMLKVVSTDYSGNSIRNEACISEDTDPDGNPIDDRDSDPDDWKEHPNHEDDEDHDYIVLKTFDLALRKFIIAVSKDTTIESSEYLKNSNGTYLRAPIVDTSKLNKLDENGKLITTAIYNHTKEPVLVQKNDIVVYMLRVYNEADVDGYASEIKDHLPSYLEFLDAEFNKQYGWTVSADGRTVTTKYLANQLIEKTTENANGVTVLSYKEVPIMCKVVERAPTSTNITNIADITEYRDENKELITDRDSESDNVNLPEDKDLPSYKDDEKGPYVPGQQDDDDFEKVVIKVFDLALRKWVTQAIVTENGKTTVTQTGHQPYDDPESIVKVDLDRKKLNKVTVKFRYSIRVINEGEIAGYAKEVTDYIPQGLKFVAEENPGWNDEGNNVISTRLLENTLLQPGEFADVEVLLTWTNSQDNMGLKVNTAEISEDYNEYGVPDIDSTPDNQKKGEDDIDDAPVMLSLKTGTIKTYFTLGLIILVTVASGVITIKKYVL